MFLRYCLEPINQIATSAMPRTILTKICLQAHGNCERPLVELYRNRADAENVFDELKNHWGFGGFCCKDKIATELAARILLLTYNLWNLFLRLMEPKRHVEGFQSRRWFLLIAARMVKSGRERVVKISVADDWRKVIRDGYRRVCWWLNSTAPQLEGGVGFFNFPTATMHHCLT
jgi:hypothetical protein